ncbi:unnamed protein product [Calicophoron daubneyi]|uniref:Uncharacterized protein n=1 Tax=Calicophoron daubneyi TaxID=300641 RepID=A0AAV2T8Q9_CALDB
MGRLKEQTNQPELKPIIGCKLPGYASKTAKTTLAGKLPILSLHPREKESVDDSVYRMRTGRILRRKKLEPNRSFSRCHKRVRFCTPKMRNCKQSPESCCRGQHNGRFPSVVGNRIDISHNGQLYLQRNIKHPPDDVFMDMFNLPPAPFLLKVASPLNRGNPHVGMRIRRKKMVISEADLNSMLPAYCAFHTTESSGPNGPLYVHSDSCHPKNSFTIDPVHILTTAVLDKLWRRKQREARGASRLPPLEHYRSPPWDLPIQHRSIQTNSQAPDQYSRSTTPNRTESFDSYEKINQDLLDSRLGYLLRT